jgi:uncharacterized protein
MMKVAVIGATGNAGSRILRELLDRGHQVTAIVRNVGLVPTHRHVVARSGDANDADALAKLLAGHEAVISSLHFLAADPVKLIAAVRGAAVPRYLVVGGAGSLQVAPGVRLVDTDDVPAAYRGESLAGAAFLDLLRATDDIGWTFLSPSAEFVPGARTGNFRLGGEAVLRDAQGRSWISYEDYAVALVGELERPKHLRQRFTVGY